MHRPKITDEIMQKPITRGGILARNKKTKKCKQQEFLGNTGYQSRDIKVQLMKGARVPGHTSKGWAVATKGGKENI